MTTTTAPAVDLSTCDREPIRTPGLIQPHGLLLALDAEGVRVTHASANCEELLGRPLDAVHGAPLADLVGEESAESLGRQLRNPALEKNPQSLGMVVPRRAAPGPEASRVRRFHAIGHRIDDVPVLELELPAGDAVYGLAETYPLIQTFIAQMQAADTMEDLCAMASREVRRVTGFDRVLVYRFDPGWNGTVIGEDRNDRLPSYLGLRFPASDIPAQARELYRLNRLRLIADASYEGVPVVAAEGAGAGAPLDMSFCVLRSVSPVHLEYMRNMGTASSMSASILHDGRLWGLVSCHGASARRVPFEVRTTCDLMAQVLALQIGSRERASEIQRRLELKAIEGRLIAQMASSESFARALGQADEDLLELTGAGGAAVVYGRHRVLVGRTPPAEFVADLSRWLSQRAGDEVYSTDELAAEFPAAADHLDVAAGITSISISQLHANCVIWFRPEAVRTVNWGGDPRKPVAGAGSAGRLHPRKSFELWKETVRGRSQPWSPMELAAAEDLRRAIVSIVLRRAEELAELTAELERSNKDLEAFSYSVSHDLRAPFRHIVGYSELLREHEAPHLTERGKRFVETIIDSAQYAGTLVDNLLSFSRMNRTALAIQPVDCRRLIDEVRRVMARDLEGRKITWRIGALPTVRADLVMLRLVWQNLLANAVKYTRPREHAVIEIAYEEPEDGRHWVFYVRDNGIGFDMAYRDKLFGVFQRLHRMEDFEGTGIGLANVRRIVARHGGQTWADGEVDRGATFYFSLPKANQTERHLG